MALLIATALGGCSSSTDQGPIPPEPTGPGSTIPMEPDIPEPFAGVGIWGGILDIGIEGDGDFVLCTETGLQLYTPYGVWKRTMSETIAPGIATSNQGQVDTGRGAMVMDPERACTPNAYYDDQYVTGGVPHVTYNIEWWGGEPDPYYPDACVLVAATSAFGGCIRPYADAISYHPETGFPFQHVMAPVCIADGDCVWPFGNTVDPGGDGPGIMAYHVMAPPIPEMIYLFFQGSVDFVVWYDGPYYLSMTGLAAAMGVDPCIPYCAAIEWNFLNPPTFMSSRDGMSAGSIWDFEFDALHRLIIVLNEADSVAITDPVEFPNNIRIQQVLGGRQNGLGTLPGEFQGPTAVAIDPRNQDIYVSDTGNGRVQVFDNDGNFKREFGGADTSFSPGAIRVDAFGAVYVSNLAGGEGDTLRVFNEYGSPIIYGTIEGWVYDKDTKLPIANARVRIMSTFAPLDAFSEEDGHFIFPAVATGTHNIAGEKYGYVSGNTVAKVKGGFKTLVDIYLKQNQTQPAGYGQVTGTVMSTLWNEPVTGMQAEVVDEPISNITNGNGEFILYSVPAGDHMLRLSRNGVVYYEKYITVTAGGILDLGWIWLPVP
jgi:DNA-binding beta-propeller fold protein YncE